MSGRHIEAAAARMAGHLVASPVIGGLLLPGHELAPDLRIKPEVLQPGGSIFYRGALHWLLRQLGECKGLAIHGEPRRVFAAALAASHQRLAAESFVVGNSDPDALRGIQALGGAVEVCGSEDEARAKADGVRRAQGYCTMPGIDQADYAAGIATVGLELAAELSTDTELVVVSPLDTAAPIAAGLAAGGACTRVEGISPGGTNVPESLRSELRAGLRLCVGESSAASLWRAMSADGAVCAVLCS